MAKDFDFNEIGKRMPYRTPEMFFENVQADVLKRADEERKRRKNFVFQWGGFITLAVAAMIFGIIFFSAPQVDLPVPDTSQVEWVAQLDENFDAMDLYVQELTDEELEEWVEFSENDIYYELTTQNSDEDED